MARQADWEAIENDYRIGQLTVRQIADKYKVNKNSISERVKKGGWKRDLSEKVRVATRALLLADRADKGVQKADAQIASAAELNRQIIESHRKDIADQRQLMGELRTELRKAQQLDAVSDDLIDAAMKSGAMGVAELGAFIKNLRNAFSLFSRVQMIKALAETAAKTVTIERQAYNLDDEDSKRPPVDPASIEKMDPMDAIKLLLAADETAGA